VSAGLILLIEGADCSGKTTLCEMLMDSLRESGKEVKYVHHTQHTNSVAEFSETLAIAVADRAAGKYTLIDRMWISEQIYGHSLRGYSKVPSDVLAAKCFYHGVMTIMCVRDDVESHISHFVRELDDGRQEMVQKREEIAKVIRAYHDFWHGHHDSKFPGMVGFFTRNCPGRMLRTMYQYDMDKHPTHEFVNWLLRLGEGQ
jgi:hypothetical protein